MLEGILNGRQRVKKDWKICENAMKGWKYTRMYYDLCGLYW